MTAQLSRERIEQYANDPRMCNVNEEIRTMARMLLAGMDGEPVAVDEIAEQAGVDPAIADAYMQGYHDSEARKAAPVAVPDERAAFESFMAERFGDCIDRRRVKNGDGEYMAWDMQVAWIVWRRRASTLKGGPVTAATVAEKCWCRTCRPVDITEMRFVVCPDCGNKRCPKANDHRNACSGSNEPGQAGSAYPAAPEQEV